MSHSSTPMPDRYLSCKQAADYLSVSHDTIRRLVKDGKLSAVVIGKRSVRIRESSLVSYVGRIGGAK